MGQKVNPIGLRLGINRTWDSRWFAGKGEYAKLMHEDMAIREALMKQLKQAADPEETKKKLEELRKEGKISQEEMDKAMEKAKENAAKMSPADQQNIQNFVKTARNNMAETNRAAAKAFLTENGKKKDVVTTASGLEYHVIAAGEGASPKSTDEVTVNYRGTLLDGTEFDSSYKRGTPASFPVNGVIPGWQEALVLMKPGAKWELFIPPNLAYDVNSPPAIPPGSMLKFEVELIKVKQPAPAVPGAKVPSQQ